MPSNIPRHDDPIEPEVKRERVDRRFAPMGIAAGRWSQLKRLDIIGQIGREHLTSNIENDEFSYPKSFRNKGQAISSPIKRNRGAIARRWTCALRGVHQAPRRLPRLVPLVPHLHGNRLPHGGVHGRSSARQRLLRDPHSYMFNVLPPYMDYWVSRAA